MVVLVTQLFAKSSYETFERPFVIEIKNPRFTRILYFENNYAIALSISPKAIFIRFSDHHEPLHI
jgi:hypothetical protein